MIGESQRVRNALNQRRQHELYGAPLGERVHRVTAALRISQSRLAQVLGISPAMLSQLVSGRRVKIGDPAVLARLLMLDQRVADNGRPRTTAAVESLLGEAAAVRWRWAHAAAAHRPATERAPCPGRSDCTGDSRIGTGGSRIDTATEALRRVAEPATLAAAAAALGSAFPAVADVLLRAAAVDGPRA